MGRQRAPPAGSGITRQHAKPQVSGMMRHSLARAGMGPRRLITRRSRVQIPPPPPANVQVRAGVQAPALLLSGRSSTGSSTGSIDTPRPTSGRGRTKPLKPTAVVVALAVPGRSVAGAVQWSAGPRLLDRENGGAHPGDLQAGYRSREVRHTLEVGERPMQMSLRVEHAVQRSARG